MANPVHAARLDWGDVDGEVGRSDEPGRKSGVSRYEKILLFLFLLTLPLINPWVRGDGIGYYAYVRALLIDHNLRFEKDWLAGNSTFLMSRVDKNGNLKADQYTATGHLNNHFSVGPAMLWAPFLVVVHVTLLGLNNLGAHIPADGFSRPYRVTLALATAFYGFVGLWLAFRLAREYFEERWAFLGTLGIWFASSLPVYMYFNPSWSHAHSAFAVALFLWYWHRTRAERTLGQWALLGLISGLMINVYYPNAILLLVPGIEGVAAYTRARKAPQVVRRLLPAHALYSIVAAIAVLPTLITKKIIYGSLFQFGYGEHWYWTSPALKSVLFSANHGLFSWTPILIPAVLGLAVLWKRDAILGGALLATFLVFCYFIACYANWHGLASYGNRFFVSLTLIFVLGLTASVAGFARLFGQAGPAFAAAGMATGCFILWNVGLMFQWGTHMIPARGPIDCRQMVYNQMAVVPGKMLRTAKDYLVARRALMGDIEREDIKQLQKQTPGGR